MNAGSRKVLFVTTVPITLASFLLPFARILRAQGWQVDAAAAGLSNETELRSGFDHLFDLNWSRSLTSLRHYRHIARELRRLQEEQGYEIIHVHTPLASFMTRLALRKLKVPPRIIYTAHGFHFYQGQRGLSAIAGRLFRTAEKYCLRYTDDIVVMNDEDERAATELLREAGRSEHRQQPRAHLHRIDGVGIDLAAWKPLTLSSERTTQLRGQYGIAEHAFAVMLIAEMNKNKRHDLLLSAAALLKKRLPQLHLLFVGTGGTQAALRARTDTERLPVSFTGQIGHTQLRELLALTDLGLLVSMREGLPRSLMEQCAAGVPIAGTPTRGIVDEVRDGRALSADDSPASVAELIVRLAGDAKLRADLAHAQLAYAHKHFALGLILDKYLALYHSEPTGMDALA